MHSSLSFARRARLLAVAAGLVLVVIGAAWALTAALTATTAALTSGPASVAELLTGASAAMALLLLLWLTLTLLISLLSGVPGRIGEGASQLRDRLAPQVVRRWGALLLGVTLASTIAPGGAAAAPPAATRSVDEPTSAAPLDAPAPRWTAVAGPAPVPEWVPVPVRTLPPVTLTAARTLAAEEEPREVVVRRGDTLWDLAAAHLSSDATDAEIATEWQRWYAANGAVIGADPDLILPGQVLRIPAPDPTTAGASR